MSKRETALRNYRRGLFTAEEYEDIILQIELSEVGISCPTCLLSEIRVEWRAVCNDPKKYAGSWILSAVNQWIDERR